MEQEPLQLAEFVRQNFGMFLLGMVLVVAFYFVFFIVMPIRREQRIARENQATNPVQVSTLPQDIVTVATFSTLPGAEACRLHLESEGITAFLADAEMVRVDWFLSNAIGSVKVQVPSDKEEAARASIEKIRKQRSEHPNQADENVCLACGTAMADDGTKCESCGWSYSDDGQGNASV